MLIVAMTVHPTPRSQVRARSGRTGSSSSRPDPCPSSSWTRRWPTCACPRRRPMLTGPCCRRPSTRLSRWSPSGRSARVRGAVLDPVRRAVVRPADNDDRRHVGDRSRRQRRHVRFQARRRRGCHQLGLRAGTWTLVYTAGWAELPAPIRTAVLELVSHLWRPQRGTAAVPSMTRPRPATSSRTGSAIAGPFTIPGFA